MKNLVLAMLLIIILVAMFVYSRTNSMAAITVVNIGSVNDYTPGTIKFIGKAKAFVIADENGIYAISAICTHAGCIIDSAGNKFQCPCHGSGFDLTGKVLEGPATKDLSWFKLELDKDNNLILDTSETVTYSTKLSRPEASK